MATIPFVYACNKEAGFVMDPNETPCVGYVTALTIGTTEHARDLKVQVPAITPLGFTGLGPQQPLPVAPQLRSNAGSQIGVVGVVEKFEWEGGVGSPLKLDFWVSQETATQLKSSQQTTLATSVINKLGWWIIDYDQETKRWYEKSFPSGATPWVTGIITGKENPELAVDLSGVPVKDGIDVMVYNVSVSVDPSANRQYTLQFANSSRLKVAKSWGSQ